MKVVVKTEISAYPLLSRGKVRDIYDVDEKTLLIVTTDRMRGKGRTADRRTQVRRGPCCCAQC